ncbi:ABC transporter ATP-binding protein [Dermacoccus nishinomiyaensis]|uniref:ABC transporter ATP-binding protein n=1 Tax=Dermacoccus nishinomiyaensis TaxID=1274 RepID=UPI001EF57DD8|nr:ABC transporter ATP-binding protein [Dermacoccus nishinomiyaensis]MCG7429047.1 ABC transporter ATP-binding protein [Dermacoccus nishinomiyaensis]
MTSLAAHDLVLRYGSGRSAGPDIVRGITFEVPENAVTVLIGANGCGKSTLFAGLARLLKPAAGDVLLDGRSIDATPTREVAKALALLPQHPIAPEGMTVAELVRQGRTPHQGLLGRGGPDDDAAVAAAMEATGVSQLAERTADSLSGGQRQRVWLAMVLAQQTGILLLDEPTSFLDIGHAVELLDVVRRRNREHGTTVVMVLHDLFLAARYADHLVAMQDGEIVAAGEPTDVLTAQLAEQLYGIPCVVHPDPNTGRPVVLPR